MTQDDWTLPEQEIAAQVGRAQSNAHPFELGKRARAEAQTSDVNPYPKGNWRHKQWLDGFNSTVAKTTQKENIEMVKAVKGGNAIQEELDIPGDPNVKLSKGAKNAAHDYAEAIISRVAASDTETKARKACEQVMLEEGLEVMPLPNGGSLVKETIQETTFRYESPKKKKAKKADENGGGEDDE